MALIRMERKGLSFRQVADIVDCHVETVRRGYRAGKIPAFRVPGAGKHGVLRVPAEWVRNKFGVDVE